MDRVSNTTNEGNTTSAHTDVPVTQLLASFVANASTSQLTPELRAKVKEVVIDYIGVVVAGLDAESTAPIYNAIVALQGKGHRGNCTVLGKGEPHMLPQYAGLLNSVLGHSWDFDDTYAAGVMHPGITTISAAMTQAELLRDSTSSEDFMLAISVGYEVSCRLARECAEYSYERGFHGTSTCGIFGAVAAIAVLRKLSADKVETAFGIAGSKAAGTLQYLENGSWNKRLNPGFAVHDAFMSVALTEAGVIGASKIFEGKMGFFRGYSSKPVKDWQGIVSNLGSNWIWMDTSLKPYPSCRWTHASIDMAGNIRKGRTVDPGSVQAITLTISPPAYSIVGEPISSKLRPSNVIDAQFSAYFQLANALLQGTSGGIQTYRNLTHPAILSISDKINVATDSSLVNFASRLQVQWADGKVDDAKLDHPLGETLNPFTRDKVDEKFISLAGPVLEDKQARAIIDIIDGLERHSLGDLLELVRGPR